MYLGKMGMANMAFEQHKTAQTVWGVLLTAMGVLLFVKTPYALRQVPESFFLNFARYFIAVILVLGGAKRLHALYFSKPEESSHED